jgi:hypothetical protein
MKNTDPTPLDKAKVEIASDIKTRQLQQYLHRPGHIPTATHPFAKQRDRQATAHQSQPHSSLGQGVARWRDRLVVIGDVAYDAIGVGVSTVIASLFRCSGKPVKR